MTVLLKNLTARMPNTQDRAALAELIRLCEGSEDSTMGSMAGDVLAKWQQPDACLSNDAWVIGTTGGQLVGFACLWREEQTCITTYLCVHPEYRCRGIGTLLLRMVEMRARQLARQVSSEQQVVLRGPINNTSAGAQRLFEREGYQPGHAFLRISCSLNQANAQPAIEGVSRKFTVDVDLEQRNQLLATTSLTEQDVLCAIHVYRTYEKELRPVICNAGYAPAELQIIGV